jgi:hypothetical protein
MNGISEKIDGIIVISTNCRLSSLDSAIISSSKKLEHV